jgi:hypothetical protein
MKLIFQIRSCGILVSYSYDITIYGAPPPLALFTIELMANLGCCQTSGFSRHLSNVDCLKAHTACLVCFISTVNGHCKKRKKKKP